MPVVSAEAFDPVDPATAFAVSQTTGAVRRRWDGFISEQHFLDGAQSAAKGVRTFTRQRFGLSMVSRYVSYAPPTNVGMVMETGPWFFEKLGGGWRFVAAPDGSGTIATWKYNFSCRPAWLAPVAERVGAVILGFEIRQRLAGFVAGCTNPEVIRSVRNGTPGS